MAWSAFLIHTTTGRIGPKVEIASLSWKVSLNNVETLSAELKKNSLPPVNAAVWLTPWWGGILLKWDDFPIFAGPIISRPTETFNGVNVECGGYRALLAKRLVADEFKDWNALAGSTKSFLRLGLGTIAKRAIETALNKTGGSLPITFPQPEENYLTGADHERNYKGYNIGNINADDILTKLAGVSGGPDIMLRPRLRDDSRFTIELFTGTELNPRIAQSHNYVWDTTAVESSVTDMQVVSTGAYMTNRVYSSGAGQDAGKLITVSEDLSALDAGFPLLESAISVSQSEDPAVVKAHGDGYLEANKDLLREITFSVRADGVNPFGTYWPGDLVKIVTKGWLTLEDGVHNCRLLTMTGTLNHDIRLSLQTE